MNSFEVHSNEIACRKSGRLGLEQVFNKAEYPSDVTVVQILLLNYQPDYTFNSQSQSNGVGNKLMFAQHGKTGYDEGKTKYKKHNHKETLTKSPAITVEKSTICGEQ